MKAIILLAVAALSAVDAYFLPGAGYNGGGGYGSAGALAAAGANGGGFGNGGFGNANAAALAAAGGGGYGAPGLGYGGAGAGAAAAAQAAGYGGGQGGFLGGGGGYGAGQASSFAGSTGGAYGNPGYYGGGFAPNAYNGFYPGWPPVFFMPPFFGNFFGPFNPFAFIGQISSEINNMVKNVATTSRFPPGCTETNFMNHMEPLVDPASQSNLGIKVNDHSNNNCAYYRVKCGGNPYMYTRCGLGGINNNNNNWQGVQMTSWGPSPASSSIMTSTSPANFGQMAGGGRGVNNNNNKMNSIWSTVVTAPIGRSSPNFGTTQHIFQSIK